MKISAKIAFRNSSMLVASLVALSGCGDGSSVADTTVPDSVSASPASFTSFIQGLAQGDETTEPLTFSPAFVAPPEDNIGDPVPVV